MAVLSVYALWILGRTCGGGGGGDCIVSGGEAMLPRSVLFMREEREGCCECEDVRAGKACDGRRSVGVPVCSTDAEGRRGGGARWVEIGREGACCRGAGASRWCKAALIETDERYW